MAKGYEKEKRWYIRASDGTDSVTLYITDDRLTGGFILANHYSTQETALQHALYLKDQSWIINQLQGRKLQVASLFVEIDGFDLGVVV